MSFSTSHIYITDADVENPTVDPTSSDGRIHIWIGNGVTSVSLVATPEQHRKFAAAITAKLDTLTEVAS